MAFQHDIPHITAKIDITPPEGPKSIGTGFLYRTLVNDGADRTITLLISNKHVFNNPKSQLIVSLKFCKRR